jgi:hypothetical protein
MSYPQYHAPYPTYAQPNTYTQNLPTPNTAFPSPLQNISYSTQENAAEIDEAVRVCFHIIENPPEEYRYVS